MNKEPCEICEKNSNVSLNRKINKYLCVTHSKQIKLFGRILKPGKIFSLKDPRGYKCDVCGKDTGEIEYISKYKGYLCGKHKTQFYRHGEIKKKTWMDKNEIIICKEYAKIILYNKENKEKNRTIIDLEDVKKCKNIRWRVTSAGYVVSGSHKFLKLSRFAIGYEGDLCIDHINHNTLDNRKINLRVVTYSQNQMNNKPRYFKRYKGVYFNKKYKKWWSSIVVKGNHIYLGIFKKRI